jgi:hypothetical protein
LLANLLVKKVSFNRDSLLFVLDYAIINNRGNSFKNLGELEELEILKKLIVNTRN